MSGKLGTYQADHCQPIAIHPGIKMLTTNTLSNGLKMYRLTEKSVSTDKHIPS